MKNKIKLPHGTLSVDANEFVVIDDVKNEPTLKSAQDFVGGYVEGITFLQVVMTLLLVLLSL
jgi:hypothetical protein